MIFRIKCYNLPKITILSKCFITQMINVSHIATDVDKDKLYRKFQYELYHKV